MEAGKYLVDKQIVMAGADNWAIEVIPNPDDSIFAPVHQLFIAKNGIYNIENLITAELAADKVYEFAFIFSPLRLKGGTGSPGNPIAIRCAKTERWFQLFSRDGSSEEGSYDETMGYGDNSWAKSSPLLLVSIVYCISFSLIVSSCDHDQSRLEKALKRIINLMSVMKSPLLIYYLKYKLGRSTMAIVRFDRLP